MGDNLCATVSKNVRDQPARVLCICSPAGQEEFFEQVGVRLDGRTTPMPKPDEAAQRAAKEKAEALTPRYRTELLKP